MNAMLRLVMVLLAATGASSCSALPVDGDHAPSAAVTAKKLGLNPTADNRSPTGFQIPVTPAQAVAELSKLLPGNVIKQIQSRDGSEVDFYETSDQLVDVAAWLYRNWQLDREDSALGRILRERGFRTQEWMGRALFEMLYQSGQSKADVDLTRLRRIAFIEEQDGMRPLTPPPSECASADKLIQSKGIWLDDVERWPHGRSIYWVTCANSTKRVYLWERGWFSPDDNLLSKISAPQSN